MQPMYTRMIETVDVLAVEMASSLAGVLNSVAFPLRAAYHAFTVVNIGRSGAPVGGLSSLTRQDIMSK